MADDICENWLPVTGFEDFYEVSNLGRVRSLDRIVRRGPDGSGYTVSPGRIRKLALNTNGYPCVPLSVDGRQHMKQVHRLVAEAFLGNPGNGMEVCHIDGDRTNAALDNLRWDTRSGNHLDMRLHGTHHYGKRDQCSRGHDYTPENTVIYDRHHRGGRSRICKTCRHENYLRRKARLAGEKAMRQARFDGDATCITIAQRRLDRLIDKLPR